MGSLLWDGAWPDPGIRIAIRPLGIEVNTVLNNGSNIDGEYVVLSGMG